MQQAGSYFGLTNASPNPCRLQGYPKVEIVDRGGHRMKPRYEGGGYIASDPGPAVVTLAPQETGWFALSWVFVNTQGSHEGCLDPTVISVVPPGVSRGLRLPVHLRTSICPDGPGVTAVGMAEGFAPGQPARSTTGS